MKNENPLTASEQLALWADKLRDLSATGLCYASTMYDRERYETLQTMAMEMMALATTQSLDTLEPLRATFFSRPSPVVVGTAAVIDSEGILLLMRRADNGLWGMPGGGMEVGETAAAAVVRETYEETGVRCEPIALVGIYDSRIWDIVRTHHSYKLTFLCRPVGEVVSPDMASHAHETLEIGWFPVDALPEPLYEGHRQRIHDTFRVWRGEMKAHFDI
jgi:ADP-ribose pyrophosphatase YjhB (NUDIX family)